jgi:ADP-heptose:LPS heptosyltransferase
MNSAANAPGEKILVVRGGALGDFILTLPVLAALRAHFPRHRLEILGCPAAASLAVASGLADRARALESRDFSGLFVPNGSWTGEIGQWFAGFDWIISYLHDPEKVFRSNVARCTSARFVAGPHRPDEAAGVPAAEQLLRPLQALGIDGADPRPRLSLPPSPQRRRLALHPGSGSERKNWPEAKWGELLRLLATRSAWEILLIGGEAEGDRCARLAAMLPAGRAELADNLPLIELAGRMQPCAGFVGHDSGITHLAAALDLPGLVLWGETVLTTWAPPSARMKILRHPGGLAGLPVGEVWEALELFGWQFDGRPSNLAGND